MQRRPNIIFIVADDLGYANLGCYGGRAAQFGPVSPNIDALAAGGLKFTEGYSNSPVCSPTRFALMTMRYQYRLKGGLEEPISSKSKGNPKLGLPHEIPTLPSLLRESGYSTALIGKWHLGYPPAFGPLRSGYNEFYGIMAGGVDYFSHFSGKGDHDLYEGENAHHAIGYLTDLLSRPAVDFVEHQAAQDEEPFFLSLQYTAPHWPWETRDDAHLAAEVAGNLFHLDGGDIDTYKRMNHRDQRALRSGDWKYLKVDEHEYLFNVAIDARERANQATRQPERLERMRADWLAWEATVPPLPEPSAGPLHYFAS